MDRAQRGDEKNGVICLVITLSKLLSLKCPKWLIVSSADGNKENHDLGKCV